MSDKGYIITKKTALVAAAAGLGLFIVLTKKREQLLTYLKCIRNPLGHKYIKIVQSADDCHRVVDELKK